MKRYAVSAGLICHLDELRRRTMKRYAVSAGLICHLDELRRRRATVAVQLQHRLLLLGAGGG